VAKTNTSSTSHKIEEYAEDLGKMLGTARAKAEGWLGQRESIVKQLTQLRDEATRFLRDLGHGAEGAVRRGRRVALNEAAVAKTVVERQRRKMSAAGRAAISAAQRKRWAKQKASDK
jgi:hypothetical protein